MDPRELLLHIDACRPGSDDIQDADMASLAAAASRDPAAMSLYQRVQAADAKIAAALRHTAHEVPEGLEARLLSAIAERAVSECAAPVASHPSKSAAGTVVRASNRAFGNVTPAAQKNAPSPSSPVGFSWRRALVGTSLVAAVVVLAVYVMNLPRPITADEVVEEIRLVYDQEVVQVRDWNNDPKSRPDADFAVPVYDLDDGEGFQAMSPWREFTFWNSDAVAYNLYGNLDPVEQQEMERRIVQGISPRRAVLFVIDRRVYGLPTSPPAVPQGQSFGPVIGVWRSESMIYALAIEGREGASVAEKTQLYQNMLHSGELARLWDDGSAERATSR